MVIKIFNNYLTFEKENTPLLITFCCCPGMDYMAPQNFLHIFEAEDCVVAFNFASEEEARHMRYVILEKQKRIGKTLLLLT